MFFITLLLLRLPPNHLQLPFLGPLPCIPQLSSWWLILLLLCLCVLHTHNTHTHLYNLLSLFLLFACTWTAINEAYPWEEIPRRPWLPVSLCLGVDPNGIPMLPCQHIHWYCPVLVSFIQSFLAEAFLSRLLGILALMIFPGPCPTASLSRGCDVDASSIKAGFPTIIDEAILCLAVLLRTVSIWCQGQLLCCGLVVTLIPERWFVQPDRISVARRSSTHTIRSTYLGVTWGLWGLVQC